ncbi:hypothetical protein HanIR_Chr05g0246561 [Helianthus annuus]|nr:hypothetical protein HanIR_Chr05g0246561 [Helianthus annuus]
MLRRLWPLIPTKTKQAMRGDCDGSDKGERDLVSRLKRNHCLRQSVDCNIFVYFLADEDSRRWWKVADRDFSFFYLIILRTHFCFGFAGFLCAFFLGLLTLHYIQMDSSSVVIKGVEDKACEHC